MKVKLLKEIRKNAKITRVGGGYKASVDSGMFWRGATCLNIGTKKEAINYLRETIIEVARNRFKRKGSLFYYS